MRILKGFLTAIIILLLTIGVFFMSFVFTADRLFLDEAFLSEHLDENGFYNRVYEQFIEAAHDEVGKTLLPKNIKAWYLDSYGDVYSQKRMVPIIKDMFLDVQKTLKNNSISFAHYDISDINRLLKEDLINTMDREIAETYSIISYDFDISHAFERQGNKEVSKDIRTEAVNRFFEEYPELNQELQTWTVEQLFGYIGYQNADHAFNLLVKWIAPIHRYILLPLLIMGMLGALLLFIWAKRVSIGLNSLAWTLIIASSIVTVLGEVMATSKKILTYLQSSLRSDVWGMTQLWNINYIKQVYGSKVVSAGFIILSVGIVFALFGLIFDNRRKRRADD